MTCAAGVEDLLRELSPRVLGDLLRRYGTAQFELCEDSLQEALIVASGQWQAGALPEHPQAWLTTVARRRAASHIRSEMARRNREVKSALLDPDGGELSEQDDSLEVLLLCCHPSLSPRAQIALTLRCVAGLSTAQIARAHLVPESTMAQRISRAKASVREAGLAFPSDEPLAARIDQALSVIYLMFTEGHTASGGEQLLDQDLTSEAIRLGRMLHQRAPDHLESGGLLALMLLSDARRPARMSADGVMIPLDAQDRTRWHAPMLAEGLELVATILPGHSPGPYLLQAAIAAVHAEAKQAADTDWPQILVLYKILETVLPGPVTTMNRAVAEGMVNGPDAGLDVLDQAARAPELAAYYRVHAVRAHLLERLGDLARARQEYQVAARMTPSMSERRYLASRAARLPAR